MSKTLIKYLWDNNREQVLRNSLVNCHARGLSSLMLLDEGGKRIRLFVANPWHELWSNKPFSDYPMSVAFHPHHCDVTLEVVSGAIWNRMLFPGTGWMRLQKYHYHSQLRGERPRFELLGDEREKWRDRSRRLESGCSVEMAASDIHTVVVSQHYPAAWLVYEGKEDPGYVPVCYSDADLTQFSFDGMYVPMSEARIVETMTEVLA